MSNGPRYSILFSDRITDKKQLHEQGYVLAGDSRFVQPPILTQLSSLSTADATHSGLGPPPLVKKYFLPRWRLSGQEKNGGVHDSGCVKLGSLTS